MRYFSKIKAGLIILAGVLLVWNICLGFNNLQTTTAVLGLKLDNKTLAFSTRAQLEREIKRQFSQKPKTLKFVYADQSLEISGSEIGAKVDPAVLTDKLIKAGREGNFWENLVFQTESLLGLKREKITGEISQSLLTIKMVEIQNQVNKDAVPIRPDFLGDVNKTLPAQEGVRVDTNKLTVLIADNIFDPPRRPLVLPTMKTFTTHKEEELVPIRKQALKLANQPISITSGGLVFTLTTEDLKHLLTVIERPDPKNPKKLILVLRLDDTKLSRSLGDFAEKVENITHAEFDHHDSFSAIYSQFYSGKRKLVQIPTGQNKKVLGVSDGPKIAYLTFDDGPNAIYHPMILDILKAYNIKATFFLVGKNAQRDADITKRTYAEGHVVGNHSLTHAFLPRLATGSVLQELQTTSDILKSFDNQEVAIFRPPYGGVNLTVKQNVEKLHLKMFLWDVDPRDWSEPETQELVNRVVNNTHPGSDILLHSNHLATVRALPKIIETLTDQGYTFDQLR